jgi:hypothetical protein
MKVPVAVLPEAVVAVQVTCGMGGGATGGVRSPSQDAVEPVAYQIKPPPEATAQRAQSLLGQSNALGNPPLRSSQQ